MSQYKINLAESNDNVDFNGVASTSNYHFRKILRKRHPVSLNTTEQYYKVIQDKNNDQSTVIISEVDNHNGNAVDKQLQISVGSAYEDVNVI